MRSRMIHLMGVLMLVFVASAMVSASASASTNLISDGSFESPPVAGGSLFRDFTTGQHAGAWMVTSGAVFISVAEPPWETPPLGVQVMNL
jgi:hypothetical protein